MSPTVLYERLVLYRDISQPSEATHESVKLVLAKIDTGAYRIILLTEVGKVIHNVALNPACKISCSETVTESSLQMAQSVEEQRDLRLAFEFRFDHYDEQEMWGLAELIVSARTEAKQRKVTYEIAVATLIETVGDATAKGRHLWD